MKEVSEKKIQELTDYVRRLPATPQLLTYMQLYSVVTALHFLEEYKAAGAICDAVVNSQDD